jgi:hypothetical protein
VDAESLEQLWNVDFGGGEHEELLNALDRLDGQPFVCLFAKLVYEKENQASHSSWLLQFWTEDANEGV